MSGDGGEGRVVDPIGSFHPYKVTLVFGHEFIEQVSHRRVGTVTIVDNNAVNVLRQAHRTVDLDLRE